MIEDIQKWVVQLVAVEKLRVLMLIWVFFWITLCSCGFSKETHCREYRICWHPSFLLLPRNNAYYTLPKVKEEKKKTACYRFSLLMQHWVSTQRNCESTTRIKPSTNQRPSFWSYPVTVYTMLSQWKLNIIIIIMIIVYWQMKDITNFLKQVINITVVCLT